MPSLIQGLKNLTGGDGRKTAYKKTPDPKTGFENLSETEKLQTLVNDIRGYDRDNRQRRNMSYYLMGLYYQGYQSVELNVDGDGYDVYERPDLYIENQFRKDVDAVVGMLNDLETEPVSRPGSDDPKDIAAARAGEPVLEMIQENIAYEQVRHLKNQYKALFGTAFIVTDYIVDKKYGTVVNPKFKYEEMPGPDGEPLMTKIADGFETRSKGSEVAIVLSPLETHCKTDIKGGIENLPWFQWLSWPDFSTVNYAYPGLNAGPSSSTEHTLAKHYMNILGNLSGNVMGQAVTLGEPTDKCELARTWIRPCEFRGDKELLRKYPDGVHVVSVNGMVADMYAENLTDKVTVERLLVLPHSFLGDGLYDAVMQQDQINITNSLIIKHLMYSTVGHKLYDQSVVDPKDVVNDPENGWIPARPQMGVPLSNSVQDLRPNTLSQDVTAWRTSLRESMQDMTTYDVAGGKSLGANAPYSQSVFLTEKSQGRWKQSVKYNRPELMRFWKQLIKIAQTDWVDDRTRSIKNNTGGWTFEAFSSADLQGNIDIALRNEDFKPKSRAEQVQAVTHLVELAPIIPMLSPKQKLAIEELLGLPADSNPMTGQIGRAYRNIDRIIKGEIVTPLPFVDDPKMQQPVYQAFLVSEKGEDLAMENPEAYANIHTLMLTGMMMGMGAANSPVGQFMAPPQEQPMQNGTPAKPGEPKPPGGQPGQQGGGPEAGSGQQMAQSPASDKQPAPPPSGA